MLKRILLAGALLAVLAAAGWGAWRLAFPASFGRSALLFVPPGGGSDPALAQDIEALNKAARRLRLDLAVRDHPSAFTESELASQRAILFLDADAASLNPAQRRELRRYVQAGGGFAAIGAVAPSAERVDEWPWFNRLVGAIALPPGEPRQATLEIADSLHPAVSFLSQIDPLACAWPAFERFYAEVEPLLARSGGESDERARLLAWRHDFDGGRIFHTALGGARGCRPEQYGRHLREGLAAVALGDDDRLDYAAAAPPLWRLRHETLLTGLDEPLMLAFRPGDGALFFIQRKGQLKRYDPQRGAAVTVAALPVVSEGESGLLGIAFSPDYLRDRLVYLQYTARREDGGAAHVTARFPLRGDELDVDGEERLLEIPVTVPETYHTGGDLQFDSSGNLWISTGDDTNPHEANGFGPNDDRPGRERFDAARTSSNSQDLRGKILRIKPRSTPQKGYDIPPGNLFADPARGRLEIYAMGLRNPYRISYDDRSGVLYWGEIGPDARDPDAARGPRGYDEFNRATAAGYFGWPLFIGANEPYAWFDFDARASMGWPDPRSPRNRSRNNSGARDLPPVRPAWIHYPYAPSTLFPEMEAGGRSAMAGPVYRRDAHRLAAHSFPERYEGRLFIHEWMRRWIKTVEVGEDGAIESIEPLMPDRRFVSPIDLAFAPDGTLHVLEYGSAWYAQNADARLGRISWRPGDSPPPQVSVSASPARGAAPLRALLSSAGSRDPAGAPLSYRWELIQSGRAPLPLGEGATLTHTFETPGEWAVRLTARSEGGAEASAGTVLRVGNEPPQIALGLTRANGATANLSFYFEPGPLRYRVQVSDLEDGGLGSGIDPGEVYARFEFLPRGAGKDPAPRALAARALLEGDGGCMSCHAWQKASVGPSFNDVAARYRGDRAGRAGLAAKVLRGGVGVWGEVQMPAHPQLSPLDAQRMVAAIFGGAEEEPGGRAALGELRFDRHLDNAHEVEGVGLGNYGDYLFEIAWRDRGGDAETITAARLYRFRYPLQFLDQADATQGALLTDIPGGGGRVALLRRSADGPSWVMFRSIELTGLKGVRVAYSASRLFADGGALEARLDSPDGPLAGRVEIEASLGSLLPTGPDFTQLPFSLDSLNGGERLRDVYFVARGEADADVYFALLSLEFLRLAE